MKRTISMSIRVSEEELRRLKKVASLQEYSSYSEFVRRTALMEAARILKENRAESDENQAEPDAHGRNSR